MDEFLLHISPPMLRKLANAGAFPDNGEFPTYEAWQDWCNSLADVFESFIAAMYLDQGLEKTSNFVMNIIKPYIEKNIDFLHDYKSELQELVQTVKKSVVYEIINETGPAHDKTFTCQVKVDDLIMGTGKGSSKKQAEQEAAKVALSKQVKII